MRNLKVGMVGLGGIAQKAYLPILSKAENFEFVGAFTPNKEKRNRICNEYRTKAFASIQDLAKECDAVFVHTSTESHYKVVKELLELGLHVYVDKPLASTVKEGEELIKLSNINKLKLMVGFNRRFAPMYKHIKDEAGEIISVNICKHASNSIRDTHFSETLIDDYIHVIDTAIWLAYGNAEISYDELLVNDNNSLIFVNHKLKSKSFSISTSMNRSAGTKLEQVEILSLGKIQRVKNLNVLEVECDNNLITTTSGAWVNILKQKGFEDIVNHFIDCIENDLEPITSGEEALKAQRLLEHIIKLHN
ncbi:Gfo/Idh/MocA family oxidoreductase [Clostridium perfringens]|nr:Gfo/Idh/MocA family oxidoreductase [Clostridium perfringens]